MSELHLFEDSGRFEVWLDTEAAERDGLCIGVASTRDEALASAAADLEIALSELQDLIEQ